jgi:membrane protein YqaA with SNARE-associated domain
MLAEFLTWGQGLLSSFGYLGIFFISVIGCSTIILPIPVDIIVFSAGAVLNPYAVGIIAGLGCAIGEMTAYGVGFAGRKVYERRKRKPRKKFKRVQEIFHRYGFWAISILSFIPILPFDLVGLFSGSVKYNTKKFFIGALIGKTARCMLLAIAGSYSLSWILGMFSGG